MSAEALPLCHFIATGGTIAMRIDPALGAPVPTLNAQELISKVAGLGEVARISVQSFGNLPSDYMNPALWSELRHAVASALLRPDVAGVVVAHGTDTLEEAAWFLDLTLDSEKPIVLVGAQRNASEPDFDGPGNLLSGVRVCVSSAARGKGVLVVLNNQINAARDVAKTHTADVEAFQSGAHGFLGVVEGDRVVFSRAPLRQQLLPVISEVLPRVEIVVMYGGATGSMVTAAVNDGAKGIVVQALGLGNVNAEMHGAIVDAIARGVVVVISTRVQRGRVRPVYGFVGGGKTLRDAGAIFADDLSPQKARILLMLALQRSLAAAEIQGLFDR